jgi:hypothetical protein
MSTLKLRRRRIAPCSGASRAIRNLMQLLLDTDLFCKLGIVGLFDAAVDALGVSESDCRRLAALPHMLRRGRLPRRYGQAQCEALANRAEAIAAIPDVAIDWLDTLTNVPDVDPGEAQLLSVAAETGAWLLTGDKRALRTVAQVPGFPEALTGRIITFEAVLLVLCRALGDGSVRRALSPLEEDQVVRICFSPSNAAPRDALHSYQNSLQTEVHPLILWDARQGGLR